ncbi:MAG: MmgE/PrpD family protein [Antarcticimicrobium sp.]|uniref:MmgE/PrpD family protein n=1 Tax=Antarcticimicrobium sp. TaxID=2824147 RepID=UPI0026274C5C|nr:MmgE/PrpD family protein [Antarcticimicrobium sp.]MDF1718657.1 MmgE/PrpD family protein [Antarcticimicrobium sp.]
MGLAGTAPMKVFRPAVIGGFGAVAAVGKIAGLDRDGLIHAFGAQYAQSAGSMQAHEEGTMLLALQIGFNARAAVEAVDLAAAGLVATRNTLQGRFGYFNLFEVDTFDISEPSAFGPSRVTLEYADGAVGTETVKQALGHPANPVTEQQRAEKFRANCRAAVLPLSEAQSSALMACIEDLDALDDLRGLMDLTCPEGGWPSRVQRLGMIPRHSPF